jgi:nucleolin
MAAPSTPKAAEGDSTRCFIGNLPWSIDDEQIKAFFADAGEITDIHWVNDRATGKFAGRGFVTFADADVCAAALAKNGQDLGGRPIRIEVSTPRPAGGDATPRGNKMAFESPSEKPEGCTTTFLGNLSFDIDDDKVKEFFADCGEIVAIRWVSDKTTGQFKGCGFVEWADSESTTKAVALSGTDLLGRPVRIYSATSTGGGGGGGENSPPPREPDETTKGR